jgi:hypothetical protein
MEPQQIVVAAMQRPGQRQEDVRRQLMHHHPLLTVGEIDRLLAGFSEHGSAHPIDAETLVLRQPAMPKGEWVPSKPSVREGDPFGNQTVRG